MTTTPSAPQSDKTLTARDLPGTCGRPGWASTPEFGLLAQLTKLVVESALGRAVRVEAHPTPAGPGPSS